MRKRHTPHGGTDPGKVGLNGTKEKEINLSITKKIQALLEKDNITCVMTRTEDTNSDGQTDQTKIKDMKNRVAVINKTKPVIAVSIHQNSYPQEEVKGAQVFYYSHSSEGERFAQLMQKALLSADSDNTRQAKANDTYYLLKKTEVPTIIVEV